MFLLSVRRANSCWATGICWCWSAPLGLPCISCLFLNILASQCGGYYRVQILFVGILCLIMGLATEPIPQYLGTIPSWPLSLPRICYFAGLFAAEPSAAVQYSNALCCGPDYGAGFRSPGRFVWANEINRPGLQRSSLDSDSHAAFNFIAKKLIIIQIPGNSAQILLIKRFLHCIFMLQLFRLEWTVTPKILFVRRSG